MPYVVRKRKGKKCVYKKNKDGTQGEKVGCTDGPIKDYLAALHINANESLEEKTVKISRQKLERIIKEEVAREMQMREQQASVNTAMVADGINKAIEEVSIAAYDTEMGGKDFDEESAKSDVVTKVMKEQMGALPQDEFHSKKVRELVDLIFMLGNSSAAAQV